MDRSGDQTGLFAWDRVFGIGPNFSCWLFAACWLFVGFVVVIDVPFFFVSFCCVIFVFLINFFFLS